MIFSSNLNRPTTKQMKSLVLEMDKRVKKLIMDYFNIFQS